jgi:hypothetical protein
LASAQYAPQSGPPRRATRHPQSWLRFIRSRY